MKALRKARLGMRVTVHTTLIQTQGTGCGKTAHKYTKYFVGKEKEGGYYLPVGICKSWCNMSVCSSSRMGRSSGHCPLRLSEEPFSLLLRLHHLTRNFKLKDQECSQQHVFIRKEYMWISCWKKERQ